MNFLFAPFFLNLSQLLPAKLLYHIKISLASSLIITFLLPCEVLAEETSLSGLIDTIVNLPQNKKIYSSFGLQNHTIVIDPGHGGKDPGATHEKHLEKHIVLNYAKTLKNNLEAIGYKVILTRNDDTFLRLAARGRLTKKHNPSLFISLHADSYKNPKLRGFAVYTVTEDYLDEINQLEQDKHLEQYSTDNKILLETNKQVLPILSSFVQSDSKRKSQYLASIIIDNLGSYTKSLNNPHRHGEFKVLKTVDIPAILVELGYMSNEIDRRNLLSEEYQDKTMFILAKSIHQYFRNIIYDKK